MPPIQIFRNYGVFTNSSERVRSPSQIFHVGNTGSNTVGDAISPKSYVKKMTLCISGLRDVRCFPWSFATIQNSDRARASD